MDHTPAGALSFFVSTEAYLQPRPRLCVAVLTPAVLRCANLKTIGHVEVAIGYEELGKRVLDRN